MNNSADLQQLIERIHASGKQFVLSVTGGGSGAIAAVLEVPGASATVLEAVVPYASAALEDWLSGPVDHYCSERTARAMAMASYERARKLSGADPHMLRGIGATASLATTRPKRGPHRIHVAWQSADATAVITCELAKGERTRAEEEQIATRIIVRAVAEACGVDVDAVDDAMPAVSRRIEKAPSEWTELLLSERACVRYDESGTARPLDEATLSEKNAPAIVFPGAFNPIHTGHARMAEIATERYSQPATFELSITNVDKPPLDFVEIADRLGKLTGHRVLLTRAATFVEKARLVPGCVFIVGVDTVERIAQPKYYGNNESDRDAAIAEFESRGCRFLVFGRMVDGRFMGLRDIKLPPVLRGLCDEISQDEFRDDVSSTNLRNG